MNPQMQVCFSYLGSWLRVFGIGLGVETDLDVFTGRRLVPGCFPFGRVLVDGTVVLTLLLPVLGDRF